jgi:protein involved in plasmid replication-relaxation
MTRPAVDPIASSSGTRNRPVHGGSHEISAAQDSPLARPVRISTSRLHRIAEQMTECDRAALELVDELRLCTGAQLERAVWWQGAPENRGRVARRALKRLHDWRVLDRLPRSIGGVRAGSRGFVYGLGPAGARLMASDGRVRRLGTPGDRHIAHTLAVAELAVGLMEAERAGRLELLAVEGEPRCWRRFSGPLGSRLVLKPDLYLRVGVGSYEDRWMVEVDRATEASTTITGKARQYLAHYRTSTGTYPRVLWTVPDDRRAEVIAEALRPLPEGAARLFSICRHDQAVARIAEEASS